MSAFYGTVEGSAQTIATRRGYDQIKVSAQSWKGSIITRLYYSNDDLFVDLQTSEGSSAKGYTLFHGTLAELKSKLQ